MCAHMSYILDASVSKLIFFDNSVLDFCKKKSESLSYKRNGKVMPDLFHSFCSSRFSNRDALTCFRNIPG